MYMNGPHLSALCFFMLFGISSSLCNPSTSIRRDKSRSYQWNKDKQDGSGLNGTQRPATSSTNNAASQELSDAMKRQLWAALTVLSQVMPGCPTVSLIYFIFLHCKIQPQTY